MPSTTKMTPTKIRVPGTVAGRNWTSPIVSVETAGPSGAGGRDGRRCSGAKGVGGGGGEGSGEKGAGGGGGDGSGARGLGGGGGDGSGLPDADGADILAGWRSSLGPQQLDGPWLSCVGCWDFGWEGGSLFCSLAFFSTYFRWRPVRREGPPPDDLDEE